MSNPESFIILYLEDEMNLGSTLSERLEKEGFKIIWEKTVKSAHKMLDLQKYDCALLDVTLPDGTGFDLAKHIYEDHPDVPVVFLTAHSNPEERIEGLEIGAEDYIIKPFHFKELVLRLKKVINRAQSIKANDSKSAIQIGNAMVHFAKFQLITSENKSFTLSHKECALLKLLYDKRHTTVSRDEILDAVWSQDEFPTPRTVDNFIIRLRRMIEIDAENPQYIKTIRGVGYQLDLTSTGTQGNKK